jgi:16S rRNA (uracil1498-N3)-methyltransferase
MAIKTVYLPGLAVEAGRLRISGDEHQHLKVARAQIGEAVEIFDGKGGVWSGKVESAGKHETTVEILETRKVEREKFEIVLGLSLVKAAAFELALEKAVEVGVTRIVPVIASRSNERAPRMDRAQRIVVEAAKQSKRYHLPVLDEPIRFDAALDYSAATKIVFAERGGRPLKSALVGSPVFFLIGPEGGWTEEELDAARQKGFALVGLGESILRTETAAVVGAALIRYELQHNS